MLRAEHELAHLGVTEGHEHLAHVDGGGAQRGVQRRRALLQVRAAVVGADARIETKRDREIQAPLRRRSTDRERCWQQAVADR